MHPYLNTATKACRIAGKVLIDTMLHTNMPKNIELCYDFTAKLKKKIIDLIINIVYRSYPTHNISTTELDQVNEDKITWLIDPLSGELNFCYGIPLFGVSIAILNDDNIEHGVIYNPIADELFVASKGSGTKLNNQRMRVSNNYKIDEALLAISSDLLLKSQGNQVQSQPKIINRELGSTALELAFVASHRLDGCCSNKVNFAEIAAGCLMIKEAGGYFSTINPSEAVSSQNIIAANPKIYSELCDLFNH